MVDHFARKINLANDGEVSKVAVNDLVPGVLLGRKLLADVLADYATGWKGRQ